jgi:hypothetical protein
MGAWINKLCHIYSMEFFTVIKINEVELYSRAMCVNMDEFYIHNVLKKASCRRIYSILCDTAYKSCELCKAMLHTVYE